MSEGKKRGISRRRFLGVAGGVLAAGMLGTSGVAAVSFENGRRQAEEQWANAKVDRLANVGQVKSLSILPLIDWYAAREGLATEPGLSYLVKADGETLLFDVGLNGRAEHPSPLLRNMAALGVDLATVDTLVISHPHPDHLGGRPDQVALSAQPVDLRGIPAYLPVPLACPTTNASVVEGPQILRPGIASIGPLLRQDLTMGTIVEQSLAVNVQGKGIVLIIGCGHTTIQHIVERAEMLFEQPVYGVAGGLHFPATDTRAKLLGLPAMRILATGKWPWDPIDEGDVQEAIAFLKKRNPALVALSAHDSCDWTLGAFRDAFGTAYREVKVGQEIVV